MKHQSRLALANERREAARARLFDRVDAIKTRLAPSALADDAMNGLADHATELATRRPVTLLAAAAVVGATVLRRPLGRWLSRHRN